MAVYVVIGAKGGTGREIVKRLIEKPASEVSEVRALVRDPSTIPAGALPADARLNILAGDASKEDTLKAPFAGATAVFFAAAGKNVKDLEATDEGGVQKVAELAKAANIQRVLLVSSQMVHPTNKWSFIRLMLNNIFTGCTAPRGMMDIKFSGENLLRKSGQAYTIVRPGRLIDGPLGWGTPMVGQCNASFMSGASSTRADVASLCVAAVGHSATKDVTLEMACKPLKKGEEARIDYDTMFKSLVPGWGEVAGAP